MIGSRILARFAMTCAALLVSACGDAQDTGPVVLAPASMQGVMEEIADDWERGGHLRPVLSFAGTPALVRQVEQGAPADTVITADAQWMDWLSEHELVAEGTRRVVAGNALVLVGAESLPEYRGIEVRLAAGGDWRLAMADPETVPAGRYARETLQRMGLWEQVRPRIVPTENVRAALALVEAGEVELGIVYASDAKASARVHGAETFEFRDTPEIAYHGAVVAGSRHGDAAAFLDYLLSEEAMDVFASHGFIPNENLP